MRDRKYRNESIICSQNNETITSHCTVHRVFHLSGTALYLSFNWYENNHFHWYRYRQEQARTLKSLQSQKRYVSPLPWYSILMDMLTKVIDDEEKLLKTCPCSNTTANQASKRKKSMGKQSHLGGKRISTEKTTMQQKKRKETQLRNSMSAV